MLERDRQIEELFHAALQLEPGQRESFLSGACASDPALRSKVEALISAHEQSGSFLNSPAYDVIAGLIGRQIGHYKITTLIGRGGMGEVYRAHDSKLERDVALKVLPADLAQQSEQRLRLFQEARASASLNHPNICTVYEVGEVDGRAYIAMEIVEGRSLSALLLQGPMNPATVQRYGLQLADALAHAHEHGFVHRDLKPANVMITSEGRVKVVDFGLAKHWSREALADATTAHSLTEAGSICGTLAYMAPEQLRGQKADTRSDVWSLGIVLFEMATGKLPFSGRTGFELSSAILHDAPPPTAMPDDTQAIITRCLEKDPADRYSHAGEVRNALDAFQAHPPKAPSPHRFTRRRWVSVTLATMILLAAIVAGFNTELLRNARTRISGQPAVATRMAVLPFDNLTGDPEQEYFSDGLTEEMITQLGHIDPQQLSVIARTSAMRYKKSGKTISQIGSELGVDYILTGSARRDANRVRVTAELIKVRDQTQLWSENYDRELAGVFALQDDVARRVAGSLAPKLLPSERLPSAPVPVPPETYEAYDAYLKGSALLNVGGRQNYDAALRYFELALQINPNDAFAYSGIARVWTGRLSIGLAQPGEANTKARSAALKAIELNPNRSEPHTVLGVIKQSELDWTSAEAEYKRGIEIDPNNADVRSAYSFLLMMIRRPEDAKVQIDRALSLDPFSILTQHRYALELLLNSQRDEAVQQWRRIIQTSPDFVPAHYWLWHVFHLIDGKDDDALAQAKATWTEYGDPEVAQAITQGYAEAGYPGAMRRAAAVLEAQGQKSFPDSFSLANIYTHLGDKNQALKWLEKGFDDGESNTRSFLGLPTFDSLRSDPRFQTLMQRMNLPK
jgi:serine/threonine-protein kinase